MQNLPNQSLFRDFSANDWNQLEHQFLAQLFKIFSFLSLSTVSSNAEKMRKIEKFEELCISTSDYKLLFQSYLKKWGNLDLNQEPAGYEGGGPPY